MSRRGLSQGLRFLAPVLALRRGSWLPRGWRSSWSDVTCPLMQDWPVKNQISHPHPKLKFVEVRGQSRPSKLCGRQLGFGSSSTAHRQLSVKLDPAQSCCHVWTSPNPSYHWSMKHHTGCPYKPSTVNLPPDSFLCGYSKADCNIIPSL